MNTLEQRIHAGYETRMSDNIDLCMQCEKERMLVQVQDPVRHQWHDTDLCAVCFDNYEPPEPSGEPPITDEERYQAAAKQKRELR
jgi:hypothetical protein